MYIFSSLLAPCSFGQYQIGRPDDKSAWKKGYNQSCKREK